MLGLVLHGSHLGTGPQCCCCCCCVLPTAHVVSAYQGYPDYYVFVGLGKGKTSGGKGNKCMSERYLQVSTTPLGGWLQGAVG